MKIPILNRFTSFDVSPIHHAAWSAHTWRQCGNQPATKIDGRLITATQFASGILGYRARRIDASRPDFSPENLKPVAKVPKNQRSGQAPPGARWLDGALVDATFTTPHSYKISSDGYPRRIEQGDGRRTYQLLAWDVLAAAGIERGDKLCRYANGRRNDCRRENLRLTAPDEIAKRRSALTGVYRHHQKWRARFAMCSKRIPLGSFDTEAEAAAAVDWFYEAIRGYRPNNTDPETTRHIRERIAHLLETP